MKKILLTAFAIALAVPALAAQQDIAQLSAVTASREALRTAINTQLSAVQSNFDEIYPIIEAGPVYVNASAPADTKVVWIDTDQSNAIKVRIGEVWTVVGTAGEGSYTLPAATGTTLGGVIDGAGVTIAADGTLSADLQAVGDCTAAPCLDGSADGGNLIKLWAGTGSYWTALQGGAPDANRSWRLPIAAAPSAGETLVMTMDEYGQMGFLAAPETSGYVLSSTDAGVLSWKTDDVGSGSFIYPGAGVPNSTGSAWGTSYTVGTAANNLVQLNGSAQLPAVSAALLTNFPTLNQNTTGTAGGLSGSPNITVGTISAGAGGFGVNADGGVTAKSVTVTRTTSPSAIDLYEGTGGGDNKLTLTLSGNLAADVTLNANQILATGDVDDTPVNGVTTAPVSSNWAYDHAAAADPHTGYVLESAIGTSVQGYDADLTTAAGASAAASSTYFGKDSGGTVGFHAVPSGGGTPTTITVADTTDTTAYVALFDSATGDLGPKTDAGITYNAGTGMLTATGFTGPLTGTASGNLTASGTSTLTNKTLDTAATGNAITVPLNGVLDGAITDPADADDMIYAKAPNALTITDIHCLAEGGGTITLTLQECTAAGASCADIEGAITCDADGAEDDGTLTDGAIAAGAWIKVLYSAPTGTVNNVAWTVYGTQTW